MPEPVTAGFQLSPQQRHFCGLHNDAANAADHLAVRLEGPLDVAPLKQALKRVVERHEILRTTFQRSSGMKFPFQVVNANTDVRWEELDFRKLSSSEQDARIADALTTSPSCFRGHTLPAQFRHRPPVAFRGIFFGGFRVADGSPPAWLRLRWFARRSQRPRRGTARQLKTDPSHQHNGRCKQQRLQPAVFDFRDTEKQNGSQ